jgi:O-antigen ligase
LEQAHNDYLQTLADGGLLGGILGIAFLIILFGKGFARRETDDKFRRGVATGALAGCFAVLIHSFFDFTLHTTSNALLFLILAALATLDSRVDEGGHRGPRRRRHSRSAELESAVVPDRGLEEAKPA